MASMPFYLPASDGFELAATLHEPDSIPWNNRVVLIAGGIGFDRTFYDDYSRFLSGRGFRVLTFDYRGSGASRPAKLRGFRADLHDWAEKDVSGVLNWLKRTYPHASLFFVGHSIGGQLLGLTPQNSLIRAAVLVAAQSGHWRLWNFPRKWWIAFMWYLLLPGLSWLCGYFPGSRLGLRADLPAGVARNWARWGRNPHYISDLCGRPIRAGFASFSAPIRAYCFADDRFAPRRAVEALLEFYSAAPKELKYITPQDLGLAYLGHQGFFKEKCRDSLWIDSALWLEGSSR